MSLSHVYVVLHDQLHKLIVRESWSDHGQIRVKVHGPAQLKQTQTLGDTVHTTAKQAIDWYILNRTVIYQIDRKHYHDLLTRIEKHIADLPELQKKLEAEAAKEQ